MEQQKKREMETEKRGITLSLNRHCFEIDFVAVRALSRAQNNNVVFENYVGLEK